MNMENELPAVQGNNSFLQMVERLSINPDVDVEKIRQIMEMQEHILDRNAKQAFNAAMVRAQSKMPIVPRDKLNSQTQSKYSKYETILKLCKPIYTEEGFSVMFHEGDAKKEDEIRIIAEVMHEEGHTKTVWTDVPLDISGIKGQVNKTKTHAKGSSIQYGRSYLMKQIFNIPSGDDDDGNLAGTDIITEEQSNELYALIDEHNLNHDGQYLKRFLEYMKVDCIEEIPVKLYPKAKAAIMSAIKKVSK